MCCKRSSVKKSRYENFYMSDKDLQLLMELAEEKLQRAVTKEDALKSFIAAGILDEAGEYTEPYKELETT